jgi:polysaccharide pyruvyl transferase WcaK-like protein
MSFAQLMHRRAFLQSSLAAALAGSLRAAEDRPPRILLRSGWQIVNIGDIAHTPGVLALLEKHFPEAEVRLWASGTLQGPAAEMILRRFPKLKIVMGTIGENGKASNDELADAIAWTDFLLHGSGASFVAQKDVAAFVEHTGKPFGIYGITYSGGSSKSVQDLMGRAKFIFFRDTVSLGVAKQEGIACPILEFGPDGAFAVDLRNDAAAEAFLAANNLEAGKFLCCIPRLRYTPYWKIHNRAMTDEDRRKHARSEEMQEHDHAPLRTAIAAVVRETGNKVLVCPEDMSQMEVGKRLIVDKLPDDVRPGVVWRETYWLTDEAVSTYVRSSGLFGLEMHSPIMCLGNGVPAIVCRFAEQTSKGFMWRDIGLGEWLFDMDREEEVARIVPAVLGLVRRPEEARDKVAQAQQVVTARQRETMAVVRGSTRS